MNQETTTKLRKAYRAAVERLEQTRAKHAPLAERLPALEADREKAKREADFVADELASLEERALLGEASADAVAAAKGRHQVSAEALAKATDALEAHQRTSGKLGRQLHTLQQEVEAARREFLLAVEAYYVHQARAAALESMWSALSARHLATGGLDDIDGAFFQLAKKAFEHPGPTWPELVERMRKETGIDA